MRWVISSASPKAASHLARELDLPPLLARILVQRGIEDCLLARKFLKPRLDDLHDPFLMRDMATATSRLRQAVDRRERVLIYGDYDVDGAMATVALMTALRAVGANVEAHIPNRLTDGYGMRIPIIEQAARRGARLIVSVDTGVREHEAFHRMKELGVDGIITDHHLPGTCLPDACAILNPRRADCSYPEKNLAGAGVAFKLVQAMLGPELSPAVLQSYLKIIAIGSIADVVPLTGENRVIAHFGLAGLTEAARSSPAEAAGRAGISALLAVAGLDGKAVTAVDVAFRLAPRLNAAGRMQDASEVINLFMRPGAKEARDVAVRLDDLNRGRQRMEDEILREIRDEMQKHPQKREQFSLVVAGAGWHRGVIGIAAQRLVDLHHRPALVLAVEGDRAYGSGRSIRGLHLLNALTHCRDLFDRFGGHAQAAGFTLPASRIPELAQRLEAYARSVLKPHHLEPQLHVDAAINFKDLSMDVFHELERLEPFGCGNPTPVFAAQGDLFTPPRILKEKHLKIWLSDLGSSFEAIGWRMADFAPALKGIRRAEVAFSISENTFQGRSGLQLVLKDIHPT